MAGSKMNREKYEHRKQLVLDYYRRNRRMPSLGEILEIIGVKSRSVAHDLARRLVQEGIAQRDATGKLVPANMGGAAKVLGLVEAGFPSAAEEELTDTMSLDEYLIEKPEATYILRVKGESMADAGILEGDLVLVERNSTPREGDIVIAEVDGEWVMKYLRKKPGWTYLAPANSAYKPIYPRNKLKIEAVVKGVIRKYN